MKKLLVIMICLSALAFINCTDDSSPIDPATLIVVTSGFSSSYMSFQITGGVEAVPEYKLLDMTSGLTLDGSDYIGTFTATEEDVTHTVSITLPSPAEGSEYLEDTGNLFSYVRGNDDLSIYTDYSTDNDFRVNITEWGGPGRFMKATFSGFLCPRRNADNCLTIESGVIHALIR